MRLPEWGGAIDFSPAHEQKAITLCEAPAPHVKMIEQEQPFQMVKHSPRATTVYTKLSTIITAIRIKLSSRDGLVDGLLAIFALNHLFKNRAAIHSVTAACLDKLHDILRMYLAQFARLIHDRSRAYLVANSPISW